MTFSGYLQCKFVVVYVKEKNIYIGELEKSFAPCFSALGPLLRVVCRGGVFVAVSFKVGSLLVLLLCCLLDVG